ncbi:DUF6241 domain-containing protein [Rossellomorea marisflavi]|uniref:DUF6241 domain-containing protein n=1 Tax=Rossellomorea marisflavi TaxID=189381 RepID=UPI001EE29B90|nr:DUF6241 domain-containing protein [Rossellomorea marisflavi]UKS64984.1 DUF6241 domain-containing protein [Rossellomorea marisflavi]
MSRKWVGIILGAVLLVTVAGVYMALESLERVPKSAQSKEGSASAADVKSNQSTVTGKVDGNPFEEDVKTPISEKLMRQYIHAMSHQKVRAGEKWSFFEITDERIAFLLQQLDEKNYKNDEEYRDILTRWEKGDFSQAVGDHNTVWRLMGGNIGKAKGLLSAKQEKDYLEKQTRETR